MHDTLWLRWCSVLFVALVGTAAHAATFYVATNGDDDRSCPTVTQPEMPKRTINNAIKCLRAGDTLLIRGGVYPELLKPTVTPSGTSWTNAVTIAGYPGEKAIMRPPAKTFATEVIRLHGQQYVIFRNLVLDGVNMERFMLPTGQIPGVNGMKMTNGAHHIQVEECEIMNAPTQGILGCGEHSRILRNNIHHNGQTILDHGIYCSSEGLLVEGNEIHHNYSHGIHIYKHNGIAGTGIIVRNNRVHDQPRARGIIIGGDGNLVYNNVLWNNSTGVGVVYSGAKNIKVFNNTIFSNTKGIAVRYAPNTNMTNNIVFKNGTNFEFVSGPNANLVQFKNVTSDPLFVNESQLDFRLRLGSPAIDTGADLSDIFRFDADDAPRPHGQGFDVGAYEFGSKRKDASVPSAPGDFQVK